MADDRGRFVWYELLTADPKAAVDFYTGVVGWGTSTFEGAGSPYTMWTAGEKPIGGVMELPADAKAAGAPSHWLGYVDVPDVDATVARARELGARLHVEPRDIPNVGRFAVFSDPQGAIIAVHRSATPLLPEAPPRRGEISWHELGTTDPVAAWDFYAELFGWRKTDAFDMGPAGLYQMFGRGGAPLGGIYRTGPEMPAPPHWLYYALTDDVHAGAARVKERGGKVVNGPMEVPGGDWIVVFTDPQGALSALHHRAGGA